MYIEFIYIINFLLDFMILYGTKRLLKINKSNIRIVLSSSIGMNTIYFYLLSIILGGMIYLFDFDVGLYTNFIVIVVGSPIVLFLIVKELINHKYNINDKYSVSIIYNKKTYRLEGFVDTGNKLESPISKKSVILVNLKINTNKLIYIPYKALNTSGVIPCIRPDKVIVNDKIIDNCLIGLSKDKFELNGCNCILPNKIKEDLC